MWQQWVNAILGLWTIAVPFLGLTGATLMWTLVVTGIAVAVLAFWGIAREERPEYHREALRQSHQS